MTKVIALSGKKQSGKTTIINFLHGHEMKRHGFIKKFEISSDGDLIVNALYLDEKNKEFESMGTFSLYQNNQSFIDYASNTFWPFIKGYHFADPLKQLCINLFGLSKEQCYGTETQKNSFTTLHWENMPGVPAGPHTLAEGPMTAREFMQYYGTDICRRINPNIWTDILVQHIKDESSDLALIGDCRFENEVEVIHRI